MSSLTGEGGREGGFGGRRGLERGFKVEQLKKQGFYFSGYNFYFL